MSEGTNGNGPDRPDSLGADEQTRDFLDNPQIYDLLKSTIQNEVGAAVHQRFEGIRDRTAIVWTTVGTIMAILIAAVPTIGWNWLDDRIRTAAEIATEERVQKAAETAVEDRIQKAVEDAIDEKTAQFDAQVAALNFQVLRIDLAEGFSPDFSPRGLREAATYAINVV